MTSKTILGAALVLWCMASRAGASDQPTSRELFKRYALSACLAQGLPAIAPQASAAAAGYVQTGAGPASAYADVRGLVTAYLHRAYASQSGADLTVMKCIDLMDGPELDRLARRRIPAGKPKT